VSTVLVVAWHWRSSSLLRRQSVDKRKTVLRNQIISVTARSNVNSHRTTSSRHHLLTLSLLSHSLFPSPLSYTIRHAAPPAAANHSFLGQVNHACRHATAKCVTHGRRYPCASQHPQKAFALGFLCLRSRFTYKDNNLQFIIYMLNEAMLAEVISGEPAFCSVNRDTVEAQSHWVGLLGQLTPIKFLFHGRLSCQIS